MILILRWFVGWTRILVQVPIYHRILIGRDQKSTIYRNLLGEYRPRAATCVAIIPAV